MRGMTWAAWMARHRRARCRRRYTAATSQCHTPHRRLYATLFE